MQSPETSETLRQAMVLHFADNSNDNMFQTVRIATVGFVMMFVMSVGFLVTAVYESSHAHDLEKQLDAARHRP